MTMTKLIAVLLSWLTEPTPAPECWVARGDVEMQRLNELARDDPAAYELRPLRSALMAPEKKSKLPGDFLLFV